MVRRTIERIAIATIAAAAAFAVATGTGHGTSTGGGFIDVSRGQTARFLGTTSTCENPPKKAQVPGGQVICAVDYSAPRSIQHEPPAKFNVGLTLRCLDLGKWSRNVTPVKTYRFC